MLFKKKREKGEELAAGAPSSAPERGDAAAEEKKAKPRRKGTLARKRDEREAAREYAERKKEVVARNKANKKSLRASLRESDKLLTDTAKKQRRRRAAAKNAYDAIGFESMFADGTCELERGLFSQTIEFSDISYHAARVEDQKVYFNSYADLFNYLGPDTTLEITIANTPIPQSEVGATKFFDDADPKTREYAVEYNRVLNNKMREGCSNLRRDRYATFTVSADDYEGALPRLTPIRSSFTQSLNKLGCTVRRLGGVERAELVGSLIRCGSPVKVDYNDLLAYGMTVKDAIAPQAIDKKPDGDNTMLRIDDKYAQVLIIHKLGSQLTDRCLSSIVNLDIPLCLSLHVQALDKGTSNDFVKTKLGYIDMEIIRKQQKAALKGTDPTLASGQELSYSKNDAEELLNELQYQSQRLFQFTGVVFTYADDPETLRQQCVNIAHAAHTESMEIDVLPAQQLQALNTALPLGHNHLHHKRYLTTAQVSIMMPFATQELSQEGGGYYGQNKLSNNLIIMNRKLLSAPMGFCLGLPGSGKSFFVKREITNSYMQNPDDEFIVIDPKCEYPPLVEALGGRAFYLPQDCVNIFDVYEGTTTLTGLDPATFKAETMLAVSSQILSSGRGGALTAGERTIIDRSVRQMFARFQNSTVPPILSDFYETLKLQPEDEARGLETAYELYVEGGLNCFNRQTSFAIDNRITSFSFKGLGEDMKIMAMLIILDWVYNRTLYNEDRGVRTWLYIDEVQSLFTNDAVVRYFDKFWSEGRSWGLIPTGITQTVDRLLRHETAQNLVRTSGFLALMQQSDLDRATLSTILNLSPIQEESINRTINPGEGLLIAGNATVAFCDDWPKGILYDLWNTKPDEVGAKKAAAWATKRAAEAQFKNGPGAR